MHTLHMHAYLCSVQLNKWLKDSGSTLNKRAVVKSKLKCWAKKNAQMYPRVHSHTRAHLFIVFLIASSIQRINFKADVPWEPGVSQISHCQNETNEQNFSKQRRNNITTASNVSPCREQEDKTNQQEAAQPLNISCLLLIPRMASVHLAGLSENSGSEERTQRWSA